MNGILWISVGVAVGLLALLFFRSRDRQATGSAANTPKAAPRTSRPVAARGAPSVGTPAGLNRKQTRKFHGVSVKAGLNACKAAQELAGKRFLPAEAPVMPLAACDQSRCQCAYSHHGDRRNRDDRRSAWGTFGGFTPSVSGGNRRAKSAERRAEESPLG